MADKLHESIRRLIEDESSRSTHSNQPNATIYMVPDTLRNHNPSSYTPRITSIGPLHGQDQRLKAMHEHKVTYMYRLFYRVVEPTKKDMMHVSHNCVHAMLGLVPRARDCYAPSTTSYDDFELAEIMIIDGCFILELLYKFQYGIAESDPIFDNILLTNDIRIDLLLLENQIPFFILEVLFRLTVKRISNHISRTNLLVYFFNDTNFISNSELTITDDTMEHCHILGFIQSCYRPNATNRGEFPKMSYSATEIAGAGVSFKAHQDKNSLLAVKFIKSRCIPLLVNSCVEETCFKLPVLCINNSTPTLLRNLIAFEQCYPLSRHYVTSFAFLMDTLIDNKDDVSLLVSSNVLQHNLGGREDVTNLFNDIRNGVVLRDFYYRDEWGQLHDYCNQIWPTILISLRRVYISTTWQTLIVIAAMILFVLTLIQTIYTVRDSKN